jgi:hypothetical protein
MSDIKKGGTAFPRPSDATTGMSLRDYFAGQVAAGHAASDRGWGDGSPGAKLVRAKMFYEIADAMIQARAESIAE